MESTVSNFSADLEIAHKDEQFVCELFSANTLDYDITWVGNNKEHWHDVDTVYLLDKANALAWITREQMQSWLDKPLSKEDKDKLCAELGFKDKWNRLLGWKAIKKSLTFSMFKVTEKKSGSVRYTIISL